MRVSQLLPRKRSDLVQVTPSATVGTAIGLMRANHVGAVLVVDPDRRLLGVLSERDVVHAFASNPLNLLDKPVLEVARRDNPTAAPDDTVQSIMELMTATHSRHLPVLRHERVVGIISIGDVVKSRIEEQSQENAVLQEIARAQYFAN
jgi:CBS domain-containing protein